MKAVVRIWGSGASYHPCEPAWSLSKQRSFHCQKAPVSFALSYRDGTAESPFGRTGSAHAVGGHQPLSRASAFSVLQAVKLVPRTRFKPRVVGIVCAPAHQPLTRRISMPRHLLYLICLSLIASSPAASALANTCITPPAKIQFVLSCHPTRSANFTPLIRFAQASAQCLAYCSKTWGCPGVACGGKNREEYDKCVYACG
jgi:hypothetical protein